MEPNCTFGISNMWMRVIMLFIKSAINLGCLIRSPLMQIKLRRFFKMLPSEKIITQRYHKKCFIVYATLIRTLRRAEEINELIVWSSQRYRQDIAPLSEVHVTRQTERDSPNNHPRNSSGCKRKKICKPRRDFNKGKIFLSLNKITTKLISSVVLRIMWLRNIRSLCIWWNCT